MTVSHLNALKALESTLRNGSFAAAASELGVSPAAVGQQIRGLEAYLGRQLFFRDGRGIKPHDDTLAIQPSLNASFTAIGDLMNQLRDQPSRNRVSVSLPGSFAEHWFTPRVADFYRRHSDLDMRLNATNRMVDLSAEGFDFAIRYARPDGVRFQEWELFGDAVLPVCSPEFLRRHENWLVRRSLNKVPLVHLENRTPDPDWPDWRAWALRFGFEFDRTAPGLRLSQVGSGIQAALAGQGLVLCGLVEAHDAIQQGALVIPFDRNLCYPTGFRYRLVTPQGRRLSQVQRDFRDWVLDTAAAFRDQLALGSST